jgi:hypothetical protein
MDGKFFHATVLLMVDGVLATVPMGSRKISVSIQPWVSGTLKPLRTCTQYRLGGNRTPITILAFTASLLDFL